jgi:dihydrodipicolinate synthase/N-acetylneuraminate lyase
LLKIGVFEVLKYKKKEAKEWIKENFTGDIPTLPTWFKENGEVDYDAMRFNFRHILKFGTEGYAVNAYAGEQNSLTKEEKFKIFELTVEEAHRNKVLAMTSVIEPLEVALERIKHAEAIGGDAVWLSGPPGRNVSDDAVYQWYKYIADRVNIALAVFYNNIKPMTLARLAAGCPNIVSKKTVPPDKVVSILQALKKYHTEVTLFMPFHSGFPCVLNGTVPPELASHVNADLYIYNTPADQVAKRCWDLAKKGELKKAAELYYGEPLHSRIQWFTNRFRGGDATNNYADSKGIKADWPLYKYMHELLGFRGGTYCRWPHVRPTEEGKIQLKADMTRLRWIDK